MRSILADVGLSGAPAWFCVRSHPKHEHIAATHLKKNLDIDVYLPRIRFKRATRQGPIWFTEALFPSYFFARFDLATCFRKVHHARAVRSVVHFGSLWPAIPDTTIEELRATVGADQIHTVSGALQSGDAVEISGSAFHGLEALVTRVMSGGARVAVLFEFLGRQTALELSSELVVQRNR